MAGRLSVLEFQTQNPADLSILKKYSYMDDKTVEKIVSRSFSAQKKWAETSLEHRSQCLRELAKGLRGKAKELAILMAREMGKPVKDGLGEVEKCAFTCEYYADNLVKFLEPTPIRVGEKTQRVILQPLGVIFAVMPWNFPLWQVVRSLVPITASGNTYILKHSTLVAGCAELMTEIFTAALGSGVAENVFVTHEQAAQWIGDPRIRGVTMTGSSRGGREVASAAGKNLKKVLLELGGSDAYVVLVDADIEQAAQICAKSRMINNGQSCISAKRFFVPKLFREKFVNVMKEQMDKLRIGSPEAENMEVGPLAQKSFCDQLHKQVAAIQKEGAQLLWQKKSIPNGGAFFPPTILLCSGKEASFLRDEFFGPVALIYEYEDLDKAIEVANASVYGLGGAVFGKDLRAADAVARRLECGFVAINNFVASDARLPFGGVKDSGFGRELGVWGVHEFANHKTITQP